MQIDLDRQIARARVPRPMALDFAVLADGVVRNNMGVGGFTVTAVASVDGGKVTLHPTGQGFRLAGAPPSQPGEAMRRMKVVDWSEPQKTALDPED